MKVYRLLVYEGPEKWIRQTLNSEQSIKGSMSFGGMMALQPVPEDEFVPMRITEKFLAGEDKAAVLVQCGPPEGVIR